MTEQSKNMSQCAPNTPKPKSKKWGILRHSFCVFATLIALSLTAITAVIATESGTKWAIQLTEKWLDGFQVSEISGKLQNGLTLKNLKFATQGVDVSVTQARLEIDFSRLLQGEVCVQDVSLQQPQITIDTTAFPPSEHEPEKQRVSMSRLTLPLNVAINNVSVNDLQLQIDHNQITLPKFQSAVSLTRKSGLTLAPTYIDGVNVVSSIQATEYLQQQKHLAQQQIIANKHTAPVNWVALEQTLFPAFLGNIKEITLPFDIHIADLQATNWTYRSEITARDVDSVKESDIELPTDFRITMAKLQLQGEVVDFNVALKTLQLDSSLGKITALGTAQLNGEMPVNLQIHSEIESLKSGTTTIFPKTQADLNLSGSLKQITALELKTRGGVNADFTAQLELNKNQLPLQVSLKSTAAQYPFSGNDPLKIKNLELSITGNLLNYQTHLQGEVVGMGVPYSKVDLQGFGKLYQANIDKLQLNALNGSLNLSGFLSWKNGVSWQSAVKLDNINLGAFVNAFPAVLSGTFSSNGVANSEHWEVNLPEIDIQGNVSKQALNLKGNLSTSQQQWLNVSTLSLYYGNNAIQAQGILGENSDFNLSINAPNLRGLWANFTASLNGKMQLSGNISAPNLDLDLSGNTIQIQDFHLAKISAKGKINASPLMQGNLDIALNGLKYGDSLQLHNIRLIANGDEKKHELQLRSQGEPVAVNLDLSGNFDRASQHWNGIIKQTNIKTPLGEVKNNQFSVNYDNNAINANISAHCWTSKEIELCFPQAFNAGQNGEIPFDVKKLDLALVNKLIENEMLQGRLTSQGKFSWFKDKPAKLDAQLKGNNLNFAQKIDYRTFRVNVPKFNLTAQLENNNFNLKSDIAVANQGNINADLKLQDLSLSRKLGGTLKISGATLSLLNQLLSQGESVAGDITANLTFGGDLTAPTLNGEFRLNKLNAVINALPFDIKNGELLLRFQGTHSTLSGNIQTPDSRLDLDGDASWRGLDNWKTRVHAKAKEFFVNLPAIAKLKISPDVEMIASNTTLDLRGNVDIPWGRVSVESLPESAISTSSDEVILDEKTKRRSVLLLPAKRKDGVVVKSDLKINIGDDVNVNAYGLNSHLQGRLLVKQEKGQLGLYGSINLKNGRYTSFGQDLLIRKGQVSFNGLPSQPMLNIEAIRNPEAMEDSSITAGVKVIGLAYSPDVTVFSEPSLSQDQALSYILTGRSLENSGEAGSSGSVGAAVLGMGLAKSGKVVGKIGETFGISDLNLGTAGVGDSSKVVVSGNITKDLQVKYGVGLFDGLAEITLRYRLWPQLFLQSVSSTDQAVDLLYQFEF